MKRIPELIGKTPFFLREILATELPSEAIVHREFESPNLLPMFVNLSILGSNSPIVLFPIFWELCSIFGKLRVKARTRQVPPLLGITTEESAHLFQSGGRKGRGLLLWTPIGPDLFPRGSQYTAPRSGSLGCHDRRSAS